MRTRMLRLTATAGATALLVGVGALTTAGSASAATPPAAHHLERCWSVSVPHGHPPVLLCDDHDGLLGGLVDLLLG